MSESFPDSARQAIKLARQALREGRRTEAIQHAKLAAELAPEMEEPLLILGALSNPAESIEYLRKALAVNPSSEAARKGMHWAVQRLRAQTAVVLPAKPEQETKEPIPTPEPVPQVDHTQPTHLSSPDAIPPIRAKKKAKKSARTWLLPLVSGILIFCIGTLAWLAIPALQSSTAKEPYAVRPVGALFKPSLTPTVTPTPTPTNTPTPTPTATPTATPTDTPTPTPTDTPPPPPTYTPVVADMSDGIAGEEAWIDVDLTNQMVYALVGDEIVNSFLVSTGTWQHPTVTGEYNIYVKYRYTDMAGPGYYLPDVPYTMYFYQGYGLHGTYWHNNFGTPMSHGCVNLRTEDAAWLFDFASVGTLVNVHY